MVSEVGGCAEQGLHTCNLGTRYSTSPSTPLIHDGDKIVTYYDGKLPSCYIQGGWLVRPKID